MSTSMEERLRNALAQQAQATTVAPDGWRRIRARLGHDRRWRPTGFRQWLLLAPAAGVAVLALVVVAVFGGRDGDRALQVTGAPERLYLTPTGVEPRFQLRDADADPQMPQLPAGVFRAFGRRAADGVALEASAVVTVPADHALGGSTPALGTPLRVLGQEVMVALDRTGLQIPTWTQADGQTVAVMSFGLSQAELEAVVASLLPGDATTAMPALPAGFSPVRAGALPGGTPSVSFQNWEADDGARFGVSVSETPNATVDDLAWWLPGGRATKVRGKTAIYLGRGHGQLTWFERPGVTVTVDAEGLSEKEMVAIAEGLRPIDEAAWRALVLRASPLGGSSVTVSSTSEVFTMQPVVARLAPPCAAHNVGPVVAERKGGQDVACYQVGPPLVTTRDVANAALRLDGPGTWSVDFTLTAEGAGRLEGLLRTVGLGGQVVIVVDGVAVQAIQVQTTSGNGRGVVSGLDEPTARRLVERLPR